MKRLCVLAVTVTAAVALAGCGVLGTDDNSAKAAGAAAPTGGQQPTVAPTAATTTAKSGLGSVKDSGDIPDPCTLLSKAEVVDLTARKITQMDEDGAEPGAATRFCQWQQESGQLAIFLSRTTADEFDSTITGADPVDGVGQDAFQLAGHLYVLYGTVQIDVYSRGGSDDQNLTDATEVAKTLFPRI